MKIKLDENIPEESADFIRRRGHDVHTVPDERLTGQPDAVIWSATMNEGRFLVTQDLDFSDARVFEPGTHPGILLIRLHLPSRRQLLAKLKSLIETEDIQAWGGCLVIATDTKIRIRRPD